MLNKLLANLPFNPGLLDQVAFYGKRIRQEKSIRRIGFVFIGLALLVQVFAVISPPQATLAASNNDLVNGGFSSAAEAANDCRANVENYGSILANYGITCDRVASANTITINSADWNDSLWSMGRLPYGLPGETPVAIAGVTYYIRPLNAWGNTNYQALNVTSPGGQTFLLLYSCGNLTAVGQPIPVQPRPSTYQPVPVITPPAQTTPAPPAKCPYDSSLLLTDSQCVACPYNNSITASNSACKPCEASLSSQDTLACVKISKAASNQTEGITDANNTTAQAGDIINYTLNAQNTGKATVKGYVFQDNISDILDYADVQDINGGALDNTTDILSWPAVDIPASQTVQEKFTVQVKNPVPETPPSTSDPMHFDHVMTNVYGNTISIKLPMPAAQTAAQVVQTSLPNTGPGSSLLIAGAVTIVVGYFLARARLLAKETDIVRRETAAAGSI